MHVDVRYVSLGDTRNGVPRCIAHTRFQGPDVVAEPTAQPQPDPESTGTVLIDQYAGITAEMKKPGDGGTRADDAINRQNGTSNVPLQ